MKNWLLAGVLALGSTLAVLPLEADAKRLGGGNSSGMQRSMPGATPARPAAPQQAAPAAAPGAAAAPAKRNWMGPIAGLAAGLGIAALMSHLGMGEAFGNFLMMALLAVAAFFGVRMLMRRFSPAAASGTGMGRTPVAAGAAAGSGTGTGIGMGTGTRFEGLPMPRSADAVGSGSTSAWAPAAVAAAALPADFDRDGFERIAKMIFIRLQAANDTGDLNDLRTFTTPEMFAVAKLALQERGTATQTTDVVKVEAEVLDLEQSGERQVVSVRFHGQIREDLGAAPNDFDEIWHLVRFGDNPAWTIAGIQQRQ